MIKQARAFDACLARIPWGWTALIASQKGLAFSLLPVGSQAAALARLTKELGGDQPSRASLKPSSPLLRQVLQQYAEYLRGERTSFDFPFDLSRGTPFQQKAWRAARRIPYGKTHSYLQVAARAGFPRASRAVGSAMAANPLAPFIPCHRVLRGNGGLGGFGGGLSLKRRLLHLENGEFPLK